MSALNAADEHSEGAAGNNMQVNSRGAVAQVQNAIIGLCPCTNHGLKVSMYTYCNLLHCKRTKGLPKISLPHILLNPFHELLKDLVDLQAS